MTTPNTRTDVVIRAYGPGKVEPMLDVLADIWADAQPRTRRQPRRRHRRPARTRLHRQITGHLGHTGFAPVVAYAGGTPVGFGYASPCSADYWFGPHLVDQVPEDARTERLMGLCELAVRPPWQSRGIGSRLHAELLKTIAPK